MQTFHKAPAATSNKNGVYSISNGSMLQVKTETLQRSGCAEYAVGNAENLFAAGYSVSFLEALKYVTSQITYKIPANASISVCVGASFNLATFGANRYIDLYINLPDMELDCARNVVESAHQVCPYSIAVRSNIEVRLHINVEAHTTQKGT